MQTFISLENITKTYRLGEVDIPALRGVSLTIKEGDFIAIMGASGSGKTTLMNIIGCLDKPTNGRYLIEGTDIATLSRDELARIRNKKIGFVFQNFNLLARTSALENVELPLFYGSSLTGKERHRRAKAILEQLGLGDRIRHYSSQLSGGQQQRVAIARALVNQPKFLLADEPTGNLDSKSSKEIMEIVRTLNEQGLTIVMITHEPDIAEFARKRFQMKDGVII
ncbi:MAG: ABC transporter ATP-binding protein [Planctomycetes bacterium]|nr:ABC transporter ATP-binding protein [Planctomycetota bacterium]